MLVQGSSKVQNQHQELLDFHHRYNTYDIFELAKQGIVHIYWDPIKNKPDYYAGKCLTDTQITWLEEHEFKIHEDDRGRI